MASIPVEVLENYSVFCYSLQNRTITFNPIELLVEGVYGAFGRGLPSTCFMCPTGSNLFRTALLRKMLNILLLLVVVFFYMKYLGARQTPQYQINTNTLTK